MLSNDAPNKIMFMPNSKPSGHDNVPDQPASMTIAITIFVTPLSNISFHWASGRMINPKHSFIAPSIMKKITSSKVRVILPLLGSTAKKNPIENCITPVIGNRFNLETVRKLYFSHVVIMLLSWCWWYCEEA